MLHSSTVITCLMSDKKQFFLHKSVRRFVFDTFFTFNANIPAANSENLCFGGLHGNIRKKY